MKIFVKTLKGSHFEIEVKPEDKVADVKKNIETIQGSDVYPAGQQMLIHQGKVLKDETTLGENNVADKSFVVIMLSKTKASSSGAGPGTVSAASSITFADIQPYLQALEEGRLFSFSSLLGYVGIGHVDDGMRCLIWKYLFNSLYSLSWKIILRLQSGVFLHLEKGVMKKPKAKNNSLAQWSQPVSSTSQPTQPVTAAPSPAPSVTPVHSAPESAPVSTPPPAASLTDVYGQAASNLVAGSNLEAIVQQIFDMGGGSWDRDTVVRALRAAFNNPERAVEYLYSGIPEQAENPPAAQPPAGAQPAIPSMQAAQPALPPAGPNANPLDLFPQGLPNLGANAGAGNLDFLRNNPQFQALRTMVQANPQILQPMLQELGKQNPQLVRMIQDHQADFLRLINEPGEGEGNILGQLAEAMPQAVTVTPEEREAIERLEALGFDRALVLEVFFACNKNEELAANYLLDHIHEFED
ncbi:hypothetical protein OROMI_000880 [Orobanche minor]